MPWLIALAAKYVGEKFAPVLVWGIIVLVSIGVAATVWQKTVRGPYIAEGQARQLAIDDPKIKQLTLERDMAKADVATATAANKTLTDDLTALQERVTNQNTAITGLQAALKKAKAAAARAAADADQRAQAAAGEIARLTALASGPAIADAAAQAQQILSDLSDYVHAQ